MIMTVERSENAAAVEQPGQTGAQGHASPGHGVQQPRQVHREVAPARQEHQPQTSAQAQQRLQTNEMILQQLREITGVDDVRALDHAYQAGKGDLAEVVSILTNQNVSLVTNRNGEVVQVQVQVRNAQRPSGQAGRPDGRADTQEPAGVIDLTADTEDKDQEDLQRAIALSLQEAQTANTANRPQGECRPKRRKSSVSWDNVQETPREPGWPVGLKNVGNTCWFSAVIQSLFHLPVFRDLVLGFRFFPKDWPANSRESLVLHFMQELRCLFARMQGSNRKYIDPTCVVKSLRELIPFRAGETQQDVSEFTHKLLDLLEEAFIIVQRRQSPQPGGSASAKSSENEGDKKSNPMLDLFYGRIQAEGMHAGKMFTNQQTVGQYTLQVNGFKDLHESLEGATAQGEIETGHEEGSTKSGQESNSSKCWQEHWFTHLPPVLTFELSRFEFNQKLGKAEKIHHKLEFPKFLYMDRYLVKNKELTRLKREEMKSMKEEMDALQAKLDCFLNYGSGYKRLPLPDILKYTLEFAEKSTVQVTEGQVQRSNDNGSSKAANGNGLNGSEKKDEEDGSSDDFEVISAIHSADTLACLSKKTLDAVATKKAAPVPSSGDMAIPSKVHIPCPHHVTKEELAVLHTCLRRWRHEVEKEVKGLQDRILYLQAKIENLYEDNSLKQVPYQLHAVLVHEGQASAGHYWAYVRDHSQNRWLKFNDVTVTGMSWGELLRESEGGYHHASAYCLMYIDITRKDLVEVKLQWNQYDELKLMVLAENERFVAQQRDLESKQRRTMVARDEGPPANHGRGEDATSESSSGEVGDQSIHGDVQRKQPPQVKPKPANMEIQQAVRRASQQSTPLDHSGHVLKATMKTIQEVSNIQEQQGPEKALIKAVNIEYHRLRSLVEKGISRKYDPRLEHCVVYLIHNGAARVIVERTLVEQFADRGLSGDSKSIEIMKVAQSKLKIMQLSEENLKAYEKWHADYGLFQKTVMFLLRGIEFFHQERFPEALTYLVHAWTYNRQLLGEGKNYIMAADSSLITHYRTQCLKSLSEQACGLFESGDTESVDEAVQLMVELVVPCMALLQELGGTDSDQAIAEEIRSNWCDFLGQDLPDWCQEKLQDFLPQLLDCSGDLQQLRAPPAVWPSQHLAEWFSTVMQAVVQAEPDTVD
ncbi:USP25 [Branchiostoma lanceolatum]|uniref:USP25 protein n=1 Tax=Branchiostoma lanceolatum TaxID=7740 RepID=A0A8J9ZU84_BRALA|nr:USP25 [Branchiostoma lanceolatum]